MLRLVIGNKNYSSWSLRAWLYLRESGIEFEEIRVRLFTPGWRDELARYSPAGRVPVLIDGDIHVWDSLAIIEHVRESRAGAVDWPREPHQRARARAVAAEMHAGFLAVRNELPLNVRARTPLDRNTLSEACELDLERLTAVFSDSELSVGADWMFGRFSIADVMYAPVGLRLLTYGIDLGPAAARFLESLQGLDSIGEWQRDAAAEAESIDFVDNLTPRRGHAAAARLMALALVPVTADNYEAARAMRVAEDQAGFVASLRESLGDAYVYTDAEVRLAVVDNVPVGYVMTFPYREAGELRINIVRLMVDAARQGRGLGRLLLETTLGWIEEANPDVAAVRISTLPANERALALYRSAGFVERGTEDGEIALYLDRPA